MTKEQVYQDINTLVATGNIDAERLRRYIARLKTKETRNEHLIVRFSDSEKKNLMKLAKKNKMTASELVRSLITKELNNTGAGNGIIANS